MINDRYELTVGSKLMAYKFVSEGPKGKVTKIIRYTKTNLPNTYNLGFGDYNEKTDDIDDKIITNNGDSQKILRTVAATVRAFIFKYPDAKIFAIGSSIARTRLYRIGIANNLNEIQKDFEVLGLKDGMWHKFKKGENYEAFLVERKK
jgi:hypothetical protein